MTLPTDYPVCGVNESKPLTFYDFMSAHRPQSNGISRTEFLHDELDDDLKWYTSYLSGFRNRDLAQKFQETINNRVAVITDSAIANFGFTAEDLVNDITVPSFRMAMLKRALPEAENGENSEDIYERRKYFRSLVPAYTAEFRLSTADHERLHKELEELETSDRLEVYGFARLDHSVDQGTGIWTRLPQVQQALPRSVETNVGRRPSMRAPRGLDHGNGGAFPNHSLFGNFGVRQAANDQPVNGGFFRSSLTTTQAAKPQIARGLPRRDFFSQIPRTPQHPGQTFTRPISLEQRNPSPSSGQAFIPLQQHHPETTGHTPYLGPLNAQGVQVMYVPHPVPMRTEVTREVYRIPEDFEVINGRPVGAFDDWAQQGYQNGFDANHHQSAKPQLSTVGRQSQQHPRAQQPPAQNSDARTTSSRARNGIGVNRKRSNGGNRRRQSATRTVHFHTHHVHQAPARREAPVTTEHGRVRVPGNQQAPGGLASSSHPRTSAAPVVVKNQPPSGQPLPPSGLRPVVEKRDSIFDDWQGW
jgi:hypothetical protein